MSSADSLMRQESVAGPLGTLAISCVRPKSPTMMLRAVRWHQGLERLGLQLPFALVHDVGMLFAAPREQLVLGARVGPDKLTRRLPDAAEHLARYQAILAEIAESEASREAGKLKMPDDVIIVVISRLLSTIAARVGVAPSYSSALPMEVSTFERMEEQLVPMFLAVDRSFELATLQVLELTKLFVLTMSDALDLDTLRLFGMLGSDTAQGAVDQVDLLAAFESPAANDIVNFSLEILPSVLETKTRSAAGTTASFGYSGLGTKGSIDSLVLTELAWDDEELGRRLLDNEVLYFSREQSREEQRRVHYLLVDASASMRGERQTFARGMALATGKKLLLEGEDVTFRFFDARLYDPCRAKRGQLPTAQLLSFRGERGRNPARVFAELAMDLELAKHRDPRIPVVHLFTHAALYIPREMVQAVRAHAYIAGVFMLPSGGKLDLDYLDLLNAHWIVDHDTLARSDTRSDAARSILDEAQDARRGWSEPPASHSSRGLRTGRASSASIPPRSDRTGGRS